MDGIAARAVDGQVLLALTNLHPDREAPLDIEIDDETLDVVMRRVKLLEEEGIKFLCNANVGDNVEPMLLLRDVQQIQRRLVGNIKDFYRDVYRRRRAAAAATAAGHADKQRGEERRRPTCSKVCLPGLELDQNTPDAPSSCCDVAIVTRQSPPKETVSATWNRL